MPKNDKNDPKSSQRSLYKEHDMRVNYVVSLQPTNFFTKEETAVHLQYNRVLQSGFHAGDSTQLIEVIHRSFPANIRAWTTDFIQPTPKAALALNIAAELIVAYQVKVEDYQPLMEKVYAQILDEDPDFETRITENFKAKMQASEAAIKQKEDELFDLFNTKGKNAEELLKIREDARMLAELHIGKNLINEEVAAYIAQKMPSIMQDLKVQEKPKYKKSTNHDVAILGAAGSGKSHLLRTEMPHLIKEDLITLATDDYRGIHIPDTNSHEMQSTPQVFTRTQDSAYLVKELVMQRMEKLKSKPERADILFDGVTYERVLDPLIEPSKENFQAMVACLPEAREAPNRAYARALYSQDLADKGRFVNTEALIKGHKDISGSTLIEGAPLNALRTKLVNTYTSGSGIQEFGSISHATETRNGKAVTLAIIRITDIKIACDYFGKQNLNVAAKFRRDIYTAKTKPGETDTFKYNNYHKARSLLQLIALANLSEDEKLKPYYKKPKEKALEFGEPHFLYISCKRDEETGVFSFDIKILDEKRYADALNPAKTSKIKVNLFKEFLVQANMYNKMQTNLPFDDKSINTKMLAERKILGVKNLEREHTPKMGG